jgi:hypothetical protein
VQQGNGQRLERAEGRMSVRKTYHEELAEYLEEEEKNHESSLA